MTTVPEAVFAFDHDHGRPARELADLLGGKGAGLAEMTGALGLDVPPGFTIALPVFRMWRHGGWPSSLDSVVASHVAALGERMGRTLGDASDPLLLSVRSGAAVSMPGMLDTVLNLGLNDETVRGLAAATGDEAFAWDSYRRFLRMYATIVMGIDPGALAESRPVASVIGAGDGRARSAQRDRASDPRNAPGEPASPGHASASSVADLQARILAASGRSVPSDPAEQLREAIEAVFSSWDSDRARAYRQRDGIDEDAGTAVNVQAMVFGNRGTRSGTGVVFTRDPATGEPGPYGDYLVGGQGEDVVDGSAHPMPIRELADEDPEVYADLMAVLHRLEAHYRQVCDVEFTVEEGRLWLLQTRPGKLSAVAAVRTAVDFVDDPDVDLTPAEAVSRVPEPIRLRARGDLGDAGRASRLSAVPASGGGTDDALVDDAPIDDALVATGLGASPGTVTGAVVFSSEAALEATDDVVLVRPETSPKDVVGMSASVGIVTTRGGLASHAAVVARGWGIPAVVGVAALTIADDRATGPGGVVISAGDVITIDGSTGQIWLGAREAAAMSDTDREALERLERLESWAAGA
ncbi:PEP/pyruvate-binding domain-containing protein [Curtobacterium sp. Leaf261]|uniref:PEP/pyruvate-binding domain-containing protein n=1 Tax=Curtobacterium sp. Leaf261 TaxID=1736311 RepID=UPI000AF860E5|nr:PEP/pyruvate-binding domain-containing protein [Curtobacterium sp. Leaf261]